MSNSAATIEDDKVSRIALPHPGEILRLEFIEHMGLSVYAVAKAIGVSRSRINEITRERQGMTAAIAIRLGKFFGVDPQWFMNMQSRYDLRRAEDSIDLSAIAPRKAA
jgi:antitoxin HigA-1